VNRDEDAMRELLEHGGVKPFEKQCFRKDGSRVSIMIGIALLDREPMKCVCLLLDISERKKMEETLGRIRDELEIRVQERTAELGKANEELRLIPGKLIAAQENERKRIAGELHDSIGQTLAALKFHIEHIYITLKNEKTEAALDLVDRMVPVLQRSIDETRAIYMGLRPRMLEDMGVVVTLQWFCRELQNLYPVMHIEPEIGIEEDEVPEHLKIAIFRITQEALNNSAKYSKAEWVDLSLTKKDGAIELIIADDGIGMDLEYIIQSTTAKSLGLTGMKERAELTGGRFSIESAQNDGTAVKVIWKVSEVSA
jgi:signal transduction histidine kinase